MGENNNIPVSVAIIIGSQVVCGVLGVLILGPLQRKSGTFKIWIIVCMCGSIACLGTLYPMLQTYSLLLVSLISALNSFFLIPLVPMMLELACEEAFPVGEGFAVGLLYAGNNLLGFIFGTILSVIV